MEEAIARSVRLTDDADPTVPEERRRVDGASVFTVAGSTQHPSTRITAAEQRILAAADLIDGRTLNALAVELGLAETADAAIRLDPGQVTMVKTLATDRRRVQLVIAPAGAGKTTALKVLANTWTGGGGDVLGLTPSAAAAAQLAEATGIQADTLHRLTWAIDRTLPLPEWAERIGPKTLLLIDEAGMADTPNPRRRHRSCSWAGWAGVSGRRRPSTRRRRRRRRPHQPASRPRSRPSRELHRFTDPDEAAATLQVRYGNPGAVELYSDRERIRLADPDGLADRLLAAWRHDQHRGLDSLMLAPIRRQVADLNHRARTERLADQPPPAIEVALADGNHASAGDLIITRRNNRHLVSGKDWVRNGDRWTVTHTDPDGAIRALNRRIKKPVTLPSAYVQESVELGYATTIHTAQGITVDTTHTLVET